MEYSVAEFGSGGRDRTADLGVMNPNPRIHLTQTNSKVAATADFRRIYTVPNEASRLSVMLLY